MDRTTKGLLGLIAVALWGLLLRPLWSSAPAQAAVPPTPTEARTSTWIRMQVSDDYLGETHRWVNLEQAGEIRFYRRERINSASVLTTDRSFSSTGDPKQIQILRNYAERRRLR